MVAEHTFDDMTNDLKKHFIKNEDSIEMVLGRQHAKILFSEDGVECFSTSTQWIKTDTLQEAVDTVVEADKRFGNVDIFEYCNIKFANEVAYPRNDMHNVSEDELDEYIDRMQEIIAYYLSGGYKH